MLKELLNEYNLNDDQIDLLNRLREIVIEYNKNVNLTSIVDEKEFNIKHILDSISIVKYFNLDSKSILDVGSGGGFPGLVLAIVLPDSSITMIDSNNKKITFIDLAIKELKVNNATTILSRVEDSNLIEKFDVVLSRAVSPLNILLEITSFAAKIKGQIIYYKGINLDKELPNKWDRVEKELGAKFDSIVDFTLDKELERKYISFTKVSSSKKEYPRDYSQIKKKPIFN